MARPRSISDQTIIAQAYELIMEQGPSSLTFERLGTRVGLGAAALVRRFKTKHHLLLEVDRYALEYSNTKLAEAMSQTGSPVEVIIAQFVTEKAFASSLERFTNGEEFLLMDLRDQNLYANYQQSFQQRHRQVAQLLHQAQATGELDGITDLDELARHLQMVLHGVGHVWAMTQDGPIEDYITHHIHMALRPYSRSKGSSK